MNEFEVDEPLAESWQSARALAARHCSGCGWYHGIWQYLRLIGMGKTLSGQGRWYLDRIALHRKRPNVSVLISGCADYSAFAHAITGLDLGGADAPGVARIVAVDRCRTPLELNQYLSGRAGVPVENHQSDILEFETDQRFDLIFTSSFLGFFNPAQRLELFKKYVSLLKPGGEMLMANRIRSGPENIPARCPDDAVEEAVGGALKLNQMFVGPERMAEPEFEALIRDYIANGSSFPMNSAESLETALRQSGFTDIATEERMPTLPQDKVHVSGNTFAEPTPYVCVVARRPLS